MEEDPDGGRAVTDIKCSLIITLRNFQKTCTGIWNHAREIDLTANSAEWGGFWTCLGRAGRLLVSLLPRNVFTRIFEAKKFQHTES